MAIKHSFDDATYTPEQAIIKILDIKFDTLFDISVKIDELDKCSQWDYHLGLESGILKSILEAATKLLGDLKGEIHNIVEGDDYELGEAPMLNIDWEYVVDERHKSNVLDHEGNIKWTEYDYSDVKIGLEGLDVWSSHSNIDEIKNVIKSFSSNSHNDNNSVAQKQLKESKQTILEQQAQIEKYRAQLSNSYNSPAPEISQPILENGSDLIEVRIDLEDIIYNLTEKIKAHKTNGSIVVSDALELVVVALEKVVNTGSDKAKQITEQINSAQTLKSDLNNKKIIIKEQQAKIKLLESSKDQDSNSIKSSTNPLTEKQQAVLQLLDGNHPSKAPELTACLNFWHSLEVKEKNGRTLNGYESEAKKFLINNHPNVDVSAEKPRIATRFGAMVNPDEQNKKKFKINTVATKAQ